MGVIFAYLIKLAGNKTFLISAAALVAFLIAYFAIKRNWASIAYIFKSRTVKDAGKIDEDDKDAVLDLMEELYAVINNDNRFLTNREDTFNKVLELSDAQIIYLAKKYNLQYKNITEQVSGEYMPMAQEAKQGLLSRLKRLGY